MSAGHVTAWDLDLRAEPECVLRGRLVLDGAPAAGWRASLRREGTEDARAYSTVDLGEDGEFVLSARAPGRYELELRSELESGALLSLRDTVELCDGLLSCDWELETGELVGVVEPSAPGPIPERVHAYWELDGERWVAVALRVSSNGAFEGRVPLGRGQFVLPDPSWPSDSRRWPAMEAVEVPAEGVGLVRLR